jgi:hypothetical protein
MGETRRFRTFPLSSRNGEVQPQAKVEKAFRRVEEIFAKYPIVQG